MRERYGMSVVALMVACGFLVGVIAAVVLGTQGSDPPANERVATAPPAVRTAPAPSRPAPAPAPAAPKVPSVLGARLDAAKDRLAGYSVEVDGGGLFGVVVESNWVVVAQDPPGGSELQPGTPVTVTVERG